MRSLRRFIFLLALLLPIAAFSQKSVKINLQPSSGIGVGDQVALYINVSNISQSVDNPGNVPGFKVMYFTLARNESSMTIVNGKSTSSSVQQYVATLRATAEGDYSFGPVSVGGVKSNVIKYHVGPKSAKSQKPSPSPSQGAVSPSVQQPTLSKVGGNELFLKAEVSDSNPYEQQPVVYTVKLYTTYDGWQLLGAPAAPSFENCTFELVRPKSGISYETYNGKTYATAVVERYILFPTHSGNAKITGNNYSFSVKQLFEYDNEDFFSIPMYQNAQIDADAPTVNLSVRPLPPYGKKISGVGDFQVSSKIGKTNLVANQVATVHYTVSGVGNPGFVSLPDIASVLPSEIKYVKTDDKVEKTVGDDNVSGSISFDVTFIPLKEGEFEIPELQFTFFNPQTGEYYTRTAQGFKLNVRPGAKSSSQAQNLTFDPSLQTVASQQKAPAYFIDSFAYYLWYILPIVALLTVIAIYRRRIRLYSNITLLKSRKASKMARQRLRLASKAMKQKNDSLFYDEMLKALWGYLSDKLNIPGSELMRDNASARLAEAGVSDTEINKLIALIDECELAKYASNASLKPSDIYAAGCRVIDSLESSLSKKTVI